MQQPVINKKMNKDIYDKCKDFYVCKEESTWSDVWDYVEYADNFIEGQLGIDPAILSTAVDAIIDYKDPNNQINTGKFIEIMGQDAINFGSQIYGADKFSKIQDIFTSASHAGAFDAMDGDTDRFKKSIMTNASKQYNTFLPSLTNMYSGGKIQINDESNPLSERNVELIKTMGLKAATIADAHQIPISIHDCNGPVNFTVGVNLSMAVTNACTYETARGFYYGWYKELLKELPIIDHGFVSPLKGNGLGIELKDKWLENTNSIIIESKIN